MVLWWTLSRPTSSPPPQQSIEGLSDTVRVQWTQENTARVDAANAVDAVSALGYVHGMNRSWGVTVWRQAALGQLSRWFGRALVPLDRHARILGFARHARAAYDDLPASDRNRVRAYARGLNAALASTRVRQRDPFVFFGLVPERWQPWHVLAVERLLAWMAVSHAGPDADRTPPIEAFLSADRQFRQFLHLHGWDRSVAWAIGPDAAPSQSTLFVRYVLGNIADPVIQEVEIRRDGHPPVTVASLPGTIAFPTGSTPERAWAHLPNSSAHIARVRVDSNRVRDWYERIQPSDGPERLVRVYRHGDALLLSDTSSGRRRPEEPSPSADSAATRPDSSWTIQWAGLRKQSDVPHWLDVAELQDEESNSSDQNSPVALFDETGLALDSAGSWAIRGNPTVIEQTSQWALIGRTQWAHHQAHALGAHVASAPADLNQLTTSDSSTWAGALLPEYLPDLQPLADTDSVLATALPYLQNWDHRYEASSIGAVLFERWLRTYRRDIGRMPTAGERMYFAGLRRRRAFKKAVDVLAATYGPDVRRWRWERIASEDRQFLLWSADSLVSRDLRSLSTTRFAPLPRPGRGHASTLSGGPSPVDPPARGPAPTRWNGWTQTGTHEMTVRRLRFNPSAFFARSLLQNERPPAVPVSDSPVARTTRLVPVEN